MASNYITQRSLPECFVSASTTLTHPAPSSSHKLFAKAMFTQCCDAQTPTGASQVSSLARCVCWLCVVVNQLSSFWADVWLRQKNQRVVVDARPRAHTPFVPGQSRQPRQLSNRPSVQCHQPNCARSVCSGAWHSTFQVWPSLSSTGARRACHTPKSTTTGD